MLTSSFCLSSKIIWSCLVASARLRLKLSSQREPLNTELGVPNDTSKNVGLGKFWQDLEISETFLISLKVSVLHGLFLLF